MDATFAAIYFSSLLQSFIMKKFLLFLFLFSGIAATQLSAQSCCKPSPACCANQKVCTPAEMKKCTPDQLKSCSGASAADASKPQKNTCVAQKTAVKSQPADKAVAVRGKE
jgi:hypothetical protein